MLERRHFKILASVNENEGSTLAKFSMQRLCMVVPIFIETKNRNLMKISLDTHMLIVTSR